MADQLTTNEAIKLRKLHLAYPIMQILSAKLSWRHYVEYPQEHLFNKTKSADLWTIKTKNREEKNDE